MPEITPSFVMQYERRMRALTETEYLRRLNAKTTWWNKVCRTMNITGKTERITWLLNTAKIEPVGPSGTGAITFEDLVSQTVEYPSFRHGKGIKVQRDQIEDLDGSGLDILADWSMQIGNETGYYPQRLAAQFLLNAAATDHSADAYDGVPFFADATTSRTVNGTSVIGHPYNPYRPGLGGYSNWVKGSPIAASGATQFYPGALPIDDSVTVEVALQNLGKAISYISSVKMPNGVDPRFLTPAYILAPPAMAPRLRELLNAQFIAQSAGSGTGAGSADVKAVIEGFGLGQTLIANELGANFSYQGTFPFVEASTGNTKFLTNTVTGSDSTYYIVCTENATTNLGGLLYVMRKPFKITYYTGDNGGTGMDAVLDRANEFEYHCQGRMSMQPGHPYTIFRFDKT